MKQSSLSPLEKLACLGLGLALIVAVVVLIRAVAALRPLDITEVDTTIANLVAAADPCDVTPENVTARNYVWSVWNQEAAVEPSRSGFKFAVALGALLTDGVKPADRSVNFQRYLMKGLMDLPTGDSASPQKIIFEGPASERPAAVRQLVENDYRQARLAYCILRDEARVKLFLEGKPIPYETARQP